MRKIIYLDQFYFDKYQKVLKLFAQGHITHGMHFEKLQCSSGTPQYYSIRFNEKIRLILTRYPDKSSQETWVFLEALENHEYHRSKFLKGVSENSWTIDGAFLLSDDSEIKDVSSSSTTTLGASSCTTEPAVFFEKRHYCNEQFLLLDESQEAAISTTFPAVIIGGPGSGKSSILTSIVDQKLSQNRQLKKPLEEDDDEEDSDTCETLPVLYIAQSKGLIDKIRVSALGSTENIKDAIFSTYHDLVANYNHGCTIISGMKSQEQFLQWFSEPYNKKIKSKTNPEFFYQELRLMSGYTDSEYKRLNEAQNTPFGYEKEKMCELRLNYKSYLSSEKIIDTVFYELPEDFHHRYGDVLVDEAQDFSTRELKSLSCLSRDKRCIFAIDMNQCLKDRFSKTDYLVKLFHGHKSGCNVVSLSATYRCSRSVGLQANNVLAVKKICTGGTIDKTEPTGVSILASAKEGAVFWVNEKSRDGSIISTIKNDFSKSVDFAIVCCEKLKPEARVLFETPNIYTEEEIKGLEFEVVLLYKPFEDPLYKTTKKFLEHIDEISQGGPANRPKKQDPEREQYHLLFGGLFTACTRSKNQLYIYLNSEQEQSHHLKPLVLSLKPKMLPVQEQLSVKLEVSDREAWLSHVEYLLLNSGNNEVARSIYMEKVDSSADSWGSYCETIQNAHQQKKCMEEGFQRAGFQGASVKKREKKPLKAVLHEARKSDSKEVVVLEAPKKTSTSNSKTRPQYDFLKKEKDLMNFDSVIRGLRPELNDKPPTKKTFLYSEINGCSDFLSYDSSKNTEYRHYLPVELEHIIENIFTDWLGQYKKATDLLLRCREFDLNSDEKYQFFLKNQLQIFELFKGFLTNEKREDLPVEVRNFFSNVLARDDVRVFDFMLSPRAETLDRFMGIKKIHDVLLGCGDYALKISETFLFKNIPLYRIIYKRCLFFNKHIASILFLKFIADDFFKSALTKDCYFILGYQSSKIFDNECLDFIVSFVVFYRENNVRAVFWDVVYDFFSRLKSPLSFFILSANSGFRHKIISDLEFCSSEFNLIDRSFSMNFARSTVIGNFLSSLESWEDGCGFIGIDGMWGADEDGDSFNHRIFKCDEHRASIDFMLICLDNLESIIDKISIDDCVLFISVCQLASVSFILKHFSREAYDGALEKLSNKLNSVRVLSRPRSDTVSPTSKIEPLIFSTTTTSQETSHASESTTRECLEFSTEPKGP